MITWEVQLIASNNQFETSTCCKGIIAFLKLSEEIEPGLSGPQQVEWFARTSDELHNVRAALGWAAKTDVEAGLSLASNLGYIG